MNIYSYNPSSLAFKRSYVTISKENLNKFHNRSETLIETTDDGNNKDVQIISEDPAQILALASQFNKYRITNLVYHNFNKEEKSNPNKKIDMFQELENFERDNVERNKVYEMAEMAREFQLDKFPYCRSSLFMNDKYVEETDENGNILNDKEDLNERILYFELAPDYVLDESAILCEYQTPHVIINAFPDENKMYNAPYQKENKVSEIEKNRLEENYEDMLFDIAETVLFSDLPDEEISMDDEMGVDEGTDALSDIGFDEDDNDKDNFPDFTKWE